MYHDPYSGQQTRFLNADPTARFKPLYSRDLTRGEHTLVQAVKVFAIVVSAIALIVVAGYLRLM